MCTEPATQPTTTGEAIAAVTAGLRYLARADAPALDATAQEECLRALETAEAMHTAARANVLSAFHASGGCEPDGATIIPVVTGMLDSPALDTLVRFFLEAYAHGQSTGTGTPPTPGLPPGLESPAALRETLLRLAAGVLSGPGGLASLLRTGVPGVPFPTVSLPLDTGTTSEIIPGYLRRLIIMRDKHCRFPGCWRQPAACQVHHLVHREDGGPTSLDNCYLVCRFHHLIAIHRWGWRLTANADGTTTATGPGGRVLHSHSPPGQAA